MSRHIFKAKTSNDVDVVVIIGWDKPCQNYHLTILTEAEEDEIYCNISDPFVYTKDFHDNGIELVYFIGVCTGLGITLPEGLPLAVYTDNVNRTVNVVRHWD